MKKILVGLGAAGVALAMIPLFAAFEAHVINVTATIENALQVRTQDIAFGTVFPEEKLVEPLELAMSQSFFDEDRVDDIDYHIRQKPKCWNGDPQNPLFGRVTEGPNNTFICEDEGFRTLPILCPFLSKHPDQDPDNDGSLDAFHGPTSTDAWTPAVASAFDVSGRLSKIADDLTDTWGIDLVTPCFRGSCAQDNVIPSDYQLDPSLEHALFGCDLWVEVTGISESEA